MIRLVVFGCLTDITGSGELTLPLVADSDTLLRVLRENYPALGDQPYALAVNRELVHGNTPLDVPCEVALLPPYSGG